MTEKRRKKQDKIEGCSKATMLKFRLFDYYWLFCALGFLVVVLLVIFTYQISWKLFVSMATLIVMFTFFIQKQKLEEMKMFAELFKDFNIRFDDLNDDLNRIARYGIDHNKQQKDEQKLCDYFNLCAEEYLYCQKGYILPDVWRSWVYGMGNSKKLNKLGIYGQKN